MVVHSIADKSRFDFRKVQDLVVKLAESSGVPYEDAVLFAEALVWADVRGTSTHGVSRVDIYLRRIEKGLIDPAANLKTENRSPGVLVADAGKGLGQVQAVRVLERLYPIASKLGVASATIRNSQHFGASSHYCELAAEKDMILLVTTNSEPAMPAHGSTDAFFGTNPIAVSFPTGKGYSVKIDLATSVTARGNILAAAKEGREIPSGWAIDPEGHPTTDAESALQGAVLTMAGHKGYALAMLVEILSGVLSGSAVGSGIGSMYKDMDRKQNVGHFFCLFDISSFMDVAVFKDRIDHMIDSIKDGRKQPGADEIFVPGERTRKKIIENQEMGIPIDKSTLEELETLCQKRGIPFTLF